MSDHRTYKKIEVVGTSKLSIEDAIANALAECARACATWTGSRW